MQINSFSRIIQEFQLSYEGEFFDLPEDYSRYGIYNGQFDWYSKDDFRQFVLHNLIGYCFRLDVEFIETLEEGLEKYFKTVQEAEKILTDYRKLAENVLSSDQGFEEIAEYLNRFFYADADRFGPTRGIFWMGKLKDLAFGESTFATDLRKKYHFSPDPLTNEQISDFVDFLESMSYLNEKRKLLDIAIEYRGEIASMGDEPDNSFSRAQEILNELKEFVTEVKDQQNVMKIIMGDFPELKI